MGVFGTSKKEEDELREAALSSQQQRVSSENFDRRASATSNNLSHYETASEYSVSAKDNTAEDHENQYPSPKGIQTQNFAQSEKTNEPTEQLNGLAGSADSNAKTIDVNRTPHNPDVPSNNSYLSSETASANDFQPVGIEQEKEPREDENALNRQYTLERIKSGKSIEEAASEQLRHEASDRVYGVNELDWDGPDDKDNPQKWPKIKKWWVTWTAAVMCLVCSLGSSMYTASIPELMAQFGASQELCLSGLTFYLIGLAIGPSIAAPLSETYGRKPLYVISWPIAMLFTMGVGLSPNIRTLLVLRFFCGFFSSPALSIAGGTISDIWSDEPSEQSFAVAIFCLCPFLGPVMGPIIGGFSAEYKNWKWSAAWVLLMFFGAAWPSAILCPETFKKTILVRRAKKRGIKVETPTVNWMYIKKMIKFSLGMPILLLVREPIVFFMSLYIAFVFAVLFAFFEAFPVIFRGKYHMELGISGLPFISVGIGLVLGVVFYVILDKTIYFPKNPDGTRGKRDENGNIIWDAPEKRLLVAKIGAFCLPASLFWLGWTGRTGDIHWLAPTASAIPFGFGLILVFFAVVLYFSMSFPPIIVASCIAANNLLRYILASVFPLFTVQCFENLGIGWAASLFGFIALIMVPVPFVFSYFGPRFRARSKFGYAAYFKKLAEEKAAREKAHKEAGVANEPAPNTEKNVADQV
ncbi:TPO4 [Candida margitis]|uniref:TPO4 n=1 Tax=Candida margitis TaxID=1775924 RepID=UPI0022279A2F|nr:TPO4 [Candida margitis]KAI5969663.1 TPO4 [Candida margitis]